MAYNGLNKPDWSKKKQPEEADRRSRKNAVEIQKKNPNRLS